MVPGIGEQRDRIGDEARARLDRDEAEVERDADRELAIEARGGVAVAVRMIVAPRRIATIVGERDTRTLRARPTHRPSLTVPGGWRGPTTPPRSAPGAAAAECRVVSEVGDSLKKT